MVYHPSVQLADDITPLMKSVDSDKDIGRYCSRKIQFCPPVEEFPLCRYKAKIELTEMPFHCPFVMTVSYFKIFKFITSRKDLSFFILRSEGTVEKFSPLYFDVCM